MAVAFDHAAHRLYAKLTIGGKFPFEFCVVLIMVFEFERLGLFKLFVLFGDAEFELMPGQGEEGGDAEAGDHELKEVVSIEFILYSVLKGALG